MGDLPTPNESPRAAAVRLLAEWLRSGAFPGRALETVERGRPFVTEVSLGVVRRYGSLRWLLRRCAPREPEPVVAAAIFAGWYEVLFMDNSAPYAAVHETVEAARQIGAERATGFINALLRRATAERDEWRRALERQPPPVRLSHPALLFERWVRQFGQREAIALCQWNNERPEVVIRPRPERVALADYLARLRSAGIAAHPHPFDPARFLTLPRGVAPADLPGYADGDFYVQDPATAAAVDLLAPRPGERVLDACAAPGGKTLLIAEQLAGRGQLVATDRYEDRLERLRENLARSGHPEVIVRRADAGDPNAPWEGAADDAEFDAVLLDAPCTNTGVLRRRPDARWAFSPARLAQLRRQQERLLDAIARRVRAGGRLVYSTCSLESEEDEDLIVSWTARHPGWTASRARKLFPPATRTDGAYIVLLRRSESAPPTEPPRDA
jgi:16S rRNA (cytosine967-C5)-methyltransferase